MSNILTPKIEKTVDYSTFRLMTGNRLIDRNHVNKLKAEMQDNADLLVYSPILVNENMFIIDGQHRFQAAKELNLPIHYLVGKGMTVDVARHLNATQRQWTILDFAKSYADGGKESYKLFLEANARFRRLSPSIIRLYLAGGDAHEQSESFKRGRFMVEDYETAKEQLVKLEEIVIKTGVIMNAPMAKAILYSLNNEDFKYDHFMKKLDSDTAIAKFIPQNTMRNCLRSIEDVYNFQNPHGGVRLY